MNLVQRIHATVDEATVRLMKMIEYGSDNALERYAPRTMTPFRFKNLVQYYYYKYPQRPFISEEQVKELCETYGLVLGPRTAFNGKIPKKNREELNNFRLLAEDDRIEKLENLNFDLKNYIHKFLLDALREGHTRNVEFNYGIGGVEFNSEVTLKTVGVPDVVWGQRSLLENLGWAVVGDRIFVKLDGGEPPHVPLIVYCPGYGSDRYIRVMADFNHLGIYFNMEVDGPDGARYKVPVNRYRILAVNCMMRYFYWATNEALSRLKYISQSVDDMVVASVQDFDTSLLKPEGYQLKPNVADLPVPKYVPDPIILQPVMGGYLVKTKYGVEASFIESPQEN